MEEIKVGEYVRTKQGYIAKLIEIDRLLGDLIFDKPIWKVKYKPSNRINFEAFNKRLYKHSPNIIYLIEVGDIVEIKTGLYSGFMYFVQEEDYLIMLEQQTKKPDRFWFIKSIVTKEQFNQVKYEV